MDHKKLLEIGIKKRNKEISESWTYLANKYSNGLFDDGESFRLWTRNRVKNDAIKASKPKDITVSVDKSTEKFNESVEIHKDGTQSSNKLVRMSIEESKDVNFLLNAHGYDIGSWELISAKSNIWHVYSKQDGVSTLYSSKISVKPKVSGVNFDNLIKSFNQVEPIELSFDCSYKKNDKMLEIPLFDMHWGVSDLEYYRETHNRIMNRINSERWSEILFIIGQDNFHNDDFRGRTSSGTQIESVDMEKAWKESASFFCSLITQAAKRSNNNVKIVFSKGNHDETLSWAFVQYLKAKFPTLKFDDSMVERKAHVFGANFIGITHGDKARKNLHNIFPIEFPEQWAKAKNREIHMGHLHTEDAKDVFGMMIRTLATRNRTDQWHKNNGFVGGHKRFMLFEYSPDELESIYYV